MTENKKSVDIEELKKEAKRILELKKNNKDELERKTLLINMLK